MFLRVFPLVYLLTISNDSLNGLVLMVLIAVLLIATWVLVARKLVVHLAGKRKQVVEGKVVLMLGNNT